MCPYDGSGNYSLPAGSTAVTGATIVSSVHNNPITDIASALSQVLLRSGVAPMSGNLNANGNKVTGLAAADANGDAVRFEQAVLTAASAPQTITQAAIGIILTLENTDASASLGPVLSLYRNSASPAANDIMGALYFDGEDSAGNRETYGRIYSLLTDPTSGSEDADLLFGVVTGGTLAEELRLSGAALYPVTNAGLDLGAGTLRFGATYTNTIELGNPSDTTLSRASAGMLAVEGVTIEPGANRASFSAHKNGTDQTISSTSPTKITFGTEVFDAGGYFSSSTFTPPAGTVMLTACLNWNDIPDGTVAYVHIYKNGAEFKHLLFVMDGTNTGRELTIVDQCNGSDTYEVYAQASDISYRIMGGAARTFFMGTMV